jgi:RNA polymerase sigma-70 factor (ECF subfamily)
LIDSGNIKKLQLNGASMIEGDKKYFEEIYKEYFDRLYAYALIITNAESLAKDVVSDVFFNLFSSRIDLRSIKELKSYLFTSTKNQAVRSLSSDPLRFKSEYFERVASSIDKVSPEDILVGKELDNFLQKVTRQLPPMCATVFSMVRERGMTYIEVSKELDITVHTVKYHMITALSKIKTELEDHYHDTKIVDWYSAGQLMLIISPSALLGL